MLTLWDTATGSLKKQINLNSDEATCADGLGLYVKKSNHIEDTVQFLPISVEGMTKRPIISVPLGRTYPSVRLIAASGNKVIGVALHNLIDEDAQPRATLRIYDAGDGQFLHELADLPIDLSLNSDAISVSPNGRLVAYVEKKEWPGKTLSSSQVAGRVIVINAINGKPLFLNSLKSKQAVQTAFINKGAWLVVAGKDPDWIQIIDIKSDKVVKKVDGRVKAIEPTNGQKIILALQNEMVAQMVSLPSFLLGAKVGRMTDVIQQVSVASDRLYLSSANRIRDVGLLTSANELDLKTEDSFFLRDIATGRITYINSRGEGVTKLRLRTPNGREYDAELPKDEVVWGMEYIPSGKLLVIGYGAADAMKINELSEQDIDRIASDENEAEKYQSHTRWRAYLISDVGEIEMLGELLGLPTSLNISPDGQQLWIATQGGVISLALPSLIEGRRIPNLKDVNRILFADDGETLLAGSRNRIVAWHLPSGSVLGEYIGNFISDFKPIDRNQVAITIGQKLYRWSYDHTSAKTFSPPRGSVIAEDLSRYAMARSRGGVEIVSSSSKQVVSVNTTNCRVPIRFSPNGQFLLCKNSKESTYPYEYAVVDATTGKLRRSIFHKCVDIELPAFSADASILFFCSRQNEEDPTIKSMVALDIVTGQEVIMTDFAQLQSAVHLVTSENNSVVAVGLATMDGVHTVEIFRRYRDSYELVSKYTSPSYVWSLDVTPQGDLVATSNVGDITLFDPVSATVTQRIPVGNARKVRFGIDGKLVAGITTLNREVFVYDVRSGHLRQDYYLPQSDSLNSDVNNRSLFLLTRAGILEPRERGGILHSLSLSSNSSSQEIIYESEAPILGLAKVNQDTLGLLRNDGILMLYDIRKREVVAYIAMFAEGQWMAVTKDGRFEVSSFGDLPMHWIMPDDPFHPLSIEIFMRDYYEPRLLPRVLAGENFSDLPRLDQLNRAQPQVMIKEVRVEDKNAGLVAVTVEVVNSTLEIKREGKPVTMQSGAYDLRLFRDGRLVAQLPEPTEVANSGEQTREQEVAQWRRHHEIKLDPKTGKKTAIFHGIRLPRKAGLKEVEFSAYAFNTDRVKSATARTKFEVPKALIPRQARAYVVTIGVNGFERDSMSRLSYAANDAKLLSAELSKRLRNVKDPETGKLLFGDAHVVPITLVTEFGSDDQADKLVLNQATKDRIKGVIEKLAGKPVDNARLTDITNADQLQSVRPEDLVLIAFSTHGDTDRRGQFYLMPYDLGASTEETDIRQHAISSEELSVWLRTLDAGELVMIVDACHSAATVESGEFKPGPMGSRGLGQLAFDKGMRILAASQRDQYALETEKTQHGLLSYALVREGLKDNAADFKPKDARIQLSEWLSYGVKRVPGLYRDYREGKLKARTATPLDEPEGKNFISIQQPALFDFARGSGIVIQPTGY